MREIPADRPLRVCLFGTYDRVAHPRISILEAGLRSAGAEVVEAHADGWAGGTDAKLAAARRPATAVLGLARSWRRLTRAYRSAGDHDVVLVGYFGHLDVWLARLLAPRRRIVLDLFISAYDTVVLDRQTVDPRSIQARIAKAIDRWAVRMSDLALLDTDQQVAFCADLGIPARKLAAVPVGAEPWRFPFAPPAAGEGPLRVLFYATFIPLHGASTVAAAIERLAFDDVAFTVVGSGQERAAFDAAVEGVPNLTVIDWVDYDRLGELVASHDVVLGIFGSSDKAARVVPNKVYQAACAGRAVVTADTPAMRTAFSREEVVVVPSNDPDALADSLRLLAKDRGRVIDLGQRARARFERSYAPEAIGSRLATLVRSGPGSASGDGIQRSAGKPDSWVPPPRFLLRLDLVRRLLGRLPRDEPVLELGFGAGGMLEELGRQGFTKVIGTDFSHSAAVNAAARLAVLPENQRAWLVRGSLDVFDPARVRFGAILAFEVLEHVLDDAGLLAQAYSLLRPGGRMLVSVPAHMERFSAIDESVGHFRRYERHELLDRFTEAGFAVEVFWCYGYPLANALDAVRRRFTKVPEPGSPEVLLARSAESGNAVPARGLVKLLVRPVTMAPFLLLQRLFLATDRGDGYLLLARRPGSS